MRDRLLIIWLLDMESDVEKSRRISIGIVDWNGRRGGCVERIDAEQARAAAFAFAPAQGKHTRHVGREYKMKACRIIGCSGRFAPPRRYQSQVLKNSINIDFAGRRDVVILGLKANVRAAVRQAQREKRGTIHGRFEPGFQLDRSIEVEINDHAMILFTRELAHLKTAGVRGRPPIDMARAFKGLIGADAIKIVAAPAL